MCGVSGYLGGNTRIVERMNDAIAHRGPDGVGVRHLGGCIFGHRLLSIMDDANVSGQPVVSKDERYMLSYNGEIYNYRRLRTQLIEEGIHFATDSDTEVLFAGLEREGLSFLQKIEGMYALAWYDRAADTVAIARDRSGMKPLYVAKHNGHLIFSSEIRALLAAGIPSVLAREVLSTYLVLGYVPGADTLFAGIHKLLPGECQMYRASDSTLLSTVITPANTELLLEGSGRGDLRAIVGKAVAAHSIGKRPLGLYLSGGLDSTILLHELSERKEGPIRTYTTSFETDSELYNEDASRARLLTKDYDLTHHEYVVTESSFIDAVQPAMEALEEPRFNASTPAYWLLAREAARDNTVMFSGDGGDEVFLGYTRYAASKSLSRKYKTAPAWVLNAAYSLSLKRTCALRLFEQLHLERPLDRWIYLNHREGLEGRKGLLGESVSATALIEQLSLLPHVERALNGTDMENMLAELDRGLWLSDENFIRGDKINMHFGMEGRFPLVDPALLTYAQQLSSDEKMPGGLTKGLLRTAYRDTLPSYIIDKAKTGWNAPVPLWIRGALGTYVEEVLQADYYAPTSHLFDFSYLQAQLARAKTLPASEAKLALRAFIPVFFFQVWARAFSIQT